MSLLIIALSLAQLPLPDGVPTPPPPQPPEVATSPAVREAIATAEACVDTRRKGRPDAVAGHPGRGAARQAIVELVAAREEARRCINDLDALRRTPMSPHDRGVVTGRVRGLVLFWREQDDYTVAALARLIGVHTEAGHLPLLDQYCDGPVGPSPQTATDIACGRYVRPSAP